MYQSMEKTARVSEERGAMSMKWEEEKAGGSVRTAGKSSYFYPVFGSSSVMVTPSLKYLGKVCTIESSIIDEIEFLGGTFRRGQVSL